MRIIKSRRSIGVETFPFWPRASRTLDVPVPVIFPPRLLFVTFDYWARQVSRVLLHFENANKKYAFFLNSPPPSFEINLFRKKICRRRGPENVKIS